MKKIIIYTLFIFLSVTYCMGNNVSVCLDTNKINMQEKTKNEIELKDELYNVVKEFDRIFIEIGKEIYFSKAYDYYVWYKIGDSGRESVKISDSERLKVIEESLYCNSFKSIISAEFYEKILNYRSSLEDPVSLGYLLTNHDLGKSLLNILSSRIDLNCFDEDINQDPSRYMSEQDYIHYHKARIHIVNEHKAVYKNFDAEVSLAKNFDVIYFVFIKENDKWLLDGIEICPKDKEEEYDIKLIGEPRPIEYYEAEEYDFPE